MNTYLSMLFKYSTCLKSVHFRASNLFDNEKLCSGMMYKISDGL